MSDRTEFNDSYRHGEQVTVYQCNGGHAFFYPANSCPICGGVTHKTTADAKATLVSYTTVRVTPSGPRFRLGLAQIECGAKTLCIIDVGVNLENGTGLVYVKDGLYHVRPQT
ncbi:MAG: hypothetical protein JSW50_06495 [Candidatus Latescibacterota bacterium]|nr:MAG: hypothetical protein JSW50_06495 [Candidatus Latescibacterota bacterium]